VKLPHLEQAWRVTQAALALSGGEESDKEESLRRAVELIAIGNGLGSGIVMTLGADAAPADGRAQFLGGWRLCGDLGGTGGPLLVSGLAAVFSIAAAPVALGLFSLAGTIWVGYWTGRADRARLSQLSVTATATGRVRGRAPRPGPPGHR
jgi:MFS family permease